MRKNVGTVDATIRITLGLLGLAYGIGKMSRKPYRTPWFLLMMSAMEVAEGITRFCPMLYAFGTNTVMKRGKNAVIDNMLDKMMEAGGQAAQQAQKAVQQTQKTVPHKPTELSPSDRQLESEIREYVTSRDPQGKDPTETYKRDEHLYPTYS